MIYIVRDEHSEVRDQALARYVMTVHERGAPPESAEGEIDLKTMRGYISYCKM